MGERLAEFGADTAVALVTFTRPDRLVTYLDTRPLPYPALIDQDRTTYRRYGLDRGTVRRIWGWRSLRRYADIIRAGGIDQVHRPSEDSLQLGGDFVVDRAGNLAFGYWSAGPDDRPEIDRLVDAVTQL